MPLKRIIAAASAITVLVLLHRYGLIDLAAIGRSFRDHPAFIAIGAACTVIAALISVARQKIALSLLDVRVGWRTAGAAGLISQGLGAWLPASAAMTEALRIGLLLGGDRALRQRMAASTAIASVVDRIVGVGVMFLVGAAAGTSLAIAGEARSATLWLAALSAANAAIGLALILLPLAASHRSFGQMVARLQASPRLRAKAASGALAGAARLAAAAALFRARPGGLLKVVGLGAATVVLASTPSYLAVLSLHAQVPYRLILAASPITIISILLPTGMAGYGGPQLVTALVFAPLGVPPSVMVNASLIQNTLVVAVQSFLAAAAVLAEAAFPRRRFAATEGE